MRRFQKTQPETGTKLIVLRGEWLSNEELDLALKGISDRAWKALVQLAELERIDAADAVQECARGNNALLMSFNDGGQHAIMKYLANVENRRNLPST